MKTLAMRKQTGPYHGTWLGREAFGWTYRLNSRSSGPRFTAMYWVADNFLELRYVHGDGRTADFSVFSHADRHNVRSLESAERTANRWVAQQIAEINKTREENIHV